MFYILRDLSKKPVFGLFFSLIYRLYNILYGASVPLNVHIHKSNRFPHGIHGIFISQKATIGMGNVIYQQVTLGSNQIEGHSKFGAPDIGNNCIFGAGCKVIGKVIIEDDVSIASNVSVAEDIEKNVTVVPAKVRLIKK